MCIRRETREMARRSLALSPVAKPHTHMTYMLRQCTSIAYTKDKVHQHVTVYSSTSDKYRLYGYILSVYYNISSMKC